MWLRELMALGACLLPTVALGQVEVVPIPTSQISGAAAQRQVYHSGWGYLSAGGVLTGRVVCVGPTGELIPQANATVTLTRDMLLLASGNTEPDGTFSFTGLSEGVYEISAESPSCYAIHSFQAVAAASSQPAPPMHVYASSMGRSNVDEVLQSLWSPQSTLVSTRAFEEVLAPWIPSAQSPRVAIVNGMISGQVAFSNANNIPESHVIKVFRNGNLIATAQVDSMGTFSFPVQEAGTVDIVLGGSAYATLGVQLVDGTQLAARTSNGTKYVSAAMQGSPVASSLLVPAAGGISQPPPGIAPVVGPGGLPVPLGGMIPGGGFYGGGGGFGGGFGGGSGGGGGLGGLGGLAGGLLGAAGLAVGIAALEDDDEGFNANLATPLQ